MNNFNDSTNPRNRISNILATQFYTRSFYVQTNNKHTCSTVLFIEIEQINTPSSYLRIFLNRNLHITYHGRRYNKVLMTLIQMQG